MKKICTVLSVFVLCCGVLFTSCKADDPKNTDSSHNGDLSTTDTSLTADPQKLLTSEEQTTLFSTAKEVIEAAVKQAGTDVTNLISTEKILRIEWIAGGNQEFVVFVTSFLVAEDATTTEKTVVKTYYRIQQQDGTYKIVQTEASTEHGILDGLAVLGTPVEQEYETLTLEEQWDFQKENGILSIFNLLSSEKIVIPFHVNDGTGVIRYDYAFRGGRFIAARADDFGVQFASSEDGETWTVSPVEVTAEHFFEDIQVNFANASTGIITANVDRQMGYYGHLIYITNDGGLTWEVLKDNIGNSRAFYSAAIAENGSIFISYNNLSDKATNPVYYITMDYGKSWVKKNISRVPEMEGLYNTVSALQFEGAAGTLYLTGGEGAKAKFISADAGQSWSFNEETV